MGYCGGVKKHYFALHLTIFNFLEKKKKLKELSKFLSFPQKEHY